MSFRAFCALNNVFRDFFHLPLPGTIKIKPVPKPKIALRRVLNNTRGTTQIADIKIRHLFEAYQLLCTNAAHTGNVYWVF